MYACAVVQTTCLLVGIYRTNRYSAFLLSMLASLPLLWFPADSYHAGERWPQRAWEEQIWLPAMLLMTPLQAIAGLQAFFRFGERYVLAARLSGGMAAFAVAATITFWVYPYGDAVQQIAQVNKYQRIGTFVLLVAAIAWYVRWQWKEVIGRVDGTHLILLMLWVGSWMVPSLMEMPRTWQRWLQADWMVTMRTWLAVAWVVTVALRRQPAALYRVNTLHQERH